jgi:hypothetical protein
MNSKDDHVHVVANNEGAGVAAFSCDNGGKELGASSLVNGSYMCVG